MSTSFLPPVVANVLRTSASWIVLRNDLLWCGVEVKDSSGFLSFYTGPPVRDCLSCRMILSGFYTLGSSNLGSFLAAFVFARQMAWQGDPFFFHYLVLCGDAPLGNEKGVIDFGVRLWDVTYLCVWTRGPLSQDEGLLFFGIQTLFTRDFTASWASKILNLDLR